MAAQKIREILTRDFILAFFAQFTFSFVYHSFVPTLPIYLSRSGSNEVEIGVLIGIFAVSSLVLRPFIGKALLRIPEKKFMIGGALLFTLTSVGFLFTPPFWPFLIVRVFQGIGFAFFQTATLTLIANISSEVRRGQSLSYFTLAQSVSSALGPSIGMFLIIHLNFTFLFLACSCLSLCSLFISNKLGRRPVALVQDTSTEESFFLNRKAIPPSVIGFFSLFIWGALGAFFPLYAINHGVANPGLFFTATAIMLILGRTFGGRFLDIYSREKVILPCLFNYIISMTILSFSTSLPMFILVAVIWGLGNALLIPSLVAYTLDRTGSPGPAVGTFTAISDLGMILGPVIMGLIIHWTSYPIMFLCLALTGLINLNYFYFFAREKERSSNDASLSQ
jgi:MFS family permease